VDSIVGSDSLSMEVAPSEVIGSQALFNITLVSALTRPVAVQLTASDSANRLHFTCLEPEQDLGVSGLSLFIPPGGTGTVTVQARPRAGDRSGAPRTYDIEFRALDVGLGNAQAPVLAQARFMYVPRHATLARVRGVPIWAFVLPFILLIALLVIAGPEQRKSVLVIGDWTSDHPALSLRAAHVNNALAWKPESTRPGVSEGKPPAYSLSEKW